MYWIVSIYKNCVTVKTDIADMKQYYAEVKPGWSVSIERLEDTVFVRLTDQEKHSITLCMLPSNETHVFWYDLNELYKMHE